MGVARKHRAHVVARKSKTPRNKEESTEQDTISSSEIIDAAAEEAPESSDYEPFVIDGDAEEIVSNEAHGLGDEFEEEALTDAELSDDPNTSLEDDLNEELAAEVVHEVHEAAEPKDARSGFLPMMFGGVVAGAIGFLAASIWPVFQDRSAEFDPAPLVEEVTSNADGLSAVQAEVAELRSLPDASDLQMIGTQVTDLAKELEGLSSEVVSVQKSIEAAESELEAQIEDIEVRLSILESAPTAAGISAEQMSGLRAEISSLTSAAEARLATAQEEAAAIEAAAEEARKLAAQKEVQAAQEAQKQVALIDLKAAVESGVEYTEVLGDLGDVPTVLSENAETGVPTLKELQQGFPDVARTFLAETQVVPDDASSGERLIAFFKRRTNARSLTPQDGQSPDAILSRVEAKLGDGLLSEALSELEAIPEIDGSPLSNWVSQVQLRLSVVDALSQLTETN